MEITKVGTYNTPSFGAKVFILGRKETVKQHLIPKIESKAKKIGGNDDLIIFYFGKPMLDVLPGCGYTERILQQSRSIYAKSIINNIEKEKDLSYSVFHNELEDSKMIIESVCEYLQNLNSSLKTRFRPRKFRKK